MRSNSSARRGLARWLSVALSAALAACSTRAATACPFCTALGPTLAQRRERGAVVALAEVESRSPAGQTSLRVDHVFKGSQRLRGTETLTIALDTAVQPGSLLLVFGVGPADAAPAALAWHSARVDETSYAYFARSPWLSTPAPQRLRYFAAYLEHADPLVAEDAYLEFAHASFDDVARMAEHLPISRMPGWLGDPKVPPHRKGFYGLALGLARGNHVRRTSAEVLRQMIVAPEDDFRAGFDGILGGYLLLAGTAALDHVEARFLANPRAADGDVRHAQLALRFCHEHVREIPIERLRSAASRLLARSEFAASTIVDLARWQDWSSLARIEGLYTAPGYAAPAVRRAIVGYLLACPEPRAREALLRLRELDPRGVAAAEETLSLTSGIAAPGQ